MLDYVVFFSTLAAAILPLLISTFYTLLVAFEHVTHVRIITEKCVALIIHNHKIWTVIIFLNLWSLKKYLAFELVNMVRNGLPILVCT